MQKKSGRQRFASSSLLHMLNEGRHCCRPSLHQSPSNPLPDIQRSAWRHPGPEGPVYAGPENLLRASQALIRFRPGGRSGIGWASSAQGAGPWPSGASPSPRRRSRSSDPFASHDLSRRIVRRGGEGFRSSPRSRCRAHLEARPDLIQAFDFSWTFTRSVRLRMSPKVSRAKRNPLLQCTRIVKSVEECG